MGLIKKTGEKVVDSGKKFVGYDEVQGNWTTIKGWAGQLNPFAIKPGRVETFQNAYERLGLSEEELKKVYRNWFLRFYLTSILLAVGFGVTIYFSSKSGFLVFFPFLGFFAICLSQMFSSSFRMFQMRTRQLCAVKEWLSRRGEWLPLSPELPEPPRSKGTAVTIGKQSDGQ